MTTPPKKHGRRYPWADWLNGRRHFLERGEDFDCLPSNMGVMVRRAAEKWSYPCTVLVSGDTVVISPSRPK